MEQMHNILALRRPALWSKFRGLRDVPIPAARTLKEAYLLGLRTGFGQGLLEGVDIGIELACASTVTMFDFSVTASFDA